MAEDDGLAIRCQDLVRIFTAEGVEVQALQGVDLRVRRGELVAVIGVSGSGKSTLMSILAGLDVATAGTAVVAGHDLLRMSRAERVTYQREAVGFVWQQASRNLLPYLTATENIATVLSLSGRTARSARRARAADLLDLLGVGDCADRRPAELSGGQQQRVAIAVALANEPTVLLADEPTGELDETSTAEVLEAVRQVNTEVGTTTLLVTHDPSVAAHVRRTIHIRDGRIATETMRRREVGADGREQVVAEEFAVLDRLGRMQLPQEVQVELGLHHRVRLEQDEDHLGIWPEGTGWEESS
jgi:putative ABC transport system ATP-binding protein